MMATTGCGGTGAAVSALAGSSAVSSVSDSEAASSAAGATSGAVSGLAAASSTSASGAVSEAEGAVSDLDSHGSPLLTVGRSDASGLASARANPMPARLKAWTKQHRAMVRKDARKTPYPLETAGKFTLDGPIRPPLAGLTQRRSVRRLAASPRRAPGSY